ncbi:hypothetical protein [Ktedonobacter racemifer]|uniref:Uncharacterized protein n=1 Tax=Ktedonobacter racemifer DSM 44963 TaxID=485913 RepID=D6TQA2_KTERA|nr:hypothetical protein [Ktedonobacter racemifer]EFH85750.1 hypothetical protein Krac_6984 [Ktedonobacter racemifer DSM 44963]
MTSTSLSRCQCGTNAPQAKRTAYGCHKERFDCLTTGCTIGQYFG